MGLYGILNLNKDFLSYIPKGENNFIFEHSFVCIWPSFCLHLEVPGNFVIWHNFWLNGGQQPQQQQIKSLEALCEIALKKLNDQKMLSWFHIKYRQTECEQTLCTKLYLSLSNIKKVPFLSTTSSVIIIRTLPPE